MDFIGTENDDTLNGTTGNDFFDMSQGGVDHVTGGAGHDTFYFGATLTADDTIDGGDRDGADLLILKGDYSAGLVFKDTTVINISQIKLEGNFSYNLTLTENNVGNNGLKIAAKTGADQTLTLDGSAVVTESLNILTRAGHNNLIGGHQYDTFNLGKTFVAANEHIDGGVNGGALILDGHYRVFGFDAVTRANIVNVDFLFQGDHDYNLAVSSDYAAGERLVLEYGLGSGHFRVDASASAADITIRSINANTGFAVDAVLGSGDDYIDAQSRNGTTHALDLSHGGNDRVFVYGQNTVIAKMGASFTALDWFRQGDSQAQIGIVLDGDYSAGIVFNSHTIVGAAGINLTAGHSYSLTTANSSDGLYVDGSKLGEADHLFFDGSAETTGGFTLFGGAGSDTLIGGAGPNLLISGNGADVLVGGAGDDEMRGNGGRDTIDIRTGGEDSIVYTAASDSSMAYDTVIGFNTRDDGFYMNGKVNGIDNTVASGRLDDDMGTRTFRNELQSTLDASHLGAHHAVLFTPDSGSLAGTVFLVVDQNGVAGFQGGEDLVIKLEDAITLDLLSKSDFHTN